MVYMVDYFIGQKWTTKLLLHYKAVLSNVSLAIGKMMSRHEQNNIALLDYSTAFPVSRVLPFTDKLSVTVSFHLP